MKARCLVSFYANDISGTQNSIMEISDQQTFDDLLKAGYIEAVESENSTRRENVSDNPEELTPKKARTRKASGTHESQ